MKKLIELKNALLRPLADNRKGLVFKQPLDLTIYENERWAVTGTRKTDLLRVLASQFIADPPTSRKYPFIGQDFWPSQVTRLVEFGSVQIKASHLSARYESFRDEFDSSLNEYLLSTGASQEQVDVALEKFDLKGIEHRWVVGLSNGQNRRARLAYSILSHPKLLLIDEPLLGLDVHSRGAVSENLRRLHPDPFTVLGTRVQDELPEWITHVAVTDNDGIAHQGPVEEMAGILDHLKAERIASVHVGSGSKKATKEVVVKLDSISVSYRGETVLKDLSLEILRGEKLHLQGPNGSGKSTLLALITADHPQSWNSRIVLFGEPRKTGKQSYFSINERIGHASPEIHAIFPQHLSVHQAISTGYVVGSFLPPRDMTRAQETRLEDLITGFNLDPNAKFGELSLSDQKVVLFLRAIVKHPDILILDEALSAMDDVAIEKCKTIVDEYNGAVIVVSHVEQEVPPCDRVIRLRPDSGTATIESL